MDDLQHHALEAQKHPPRAIARQRALDKLFRGILNSGQLYRPPRERIPFECREAYGEIYNNAQQELMLYLCQDIERYDPERGTFMGWINMLMDRRFINMGIKQFQDGRERKHLGKRMGVEDLMRGDEDLPDPSGGHDKQDYIRQFITEDPHGILKSKQMRDRPDITLQRVLLYRLDDLTWKDIAQEVEISLPTLHAFFRRSLKSLSSYLQEMLGF